MALVMKSLILHKLPKLAPQLLDLLLGNTDLPPQDQFQTFDFSLELKMLLVLITLVPLLRPDPLCLLLLKLPQLFEKFTS